MFFSNVERVHGEAFASPRLPIWTKEGESASKWFVLTASLRSPTEGKGSGSLAPGRGLLRAGWGAERAGSVYAGVFLTCYLTGGVTVSSDTGLGGTEIVSYFNTRTSPACVETEVGGQRHKEAHGGRSASRRKAL